jgi:hypothetical protein
MSADVNIKIIKDVYDVRPVALMDLRPLVPWVFSQLGDQPDGLGRPYRQVPLPHPIRSR